MVELKDRYKDLKSTVARQQKDMGGTTAAQQENIQVRRVQGTVQPDMGAEVMQPLITSLQGTTAQVTACQHQCSTGKSAEEPALKDRAPRPMAAR